MSQDQQQVNAIDELRRTYFSDNKELYSVPDIYRNCLKCCIEGIIMSELGATIANSLDTGRFSLGLSVVVDLIRMQNTYMVVHLRQLLGKREGNSGMKLLEAISLIHNEQYFNFLEEKYIMPHCFFRKALNEHCCTKEAMQEYSSNHRGDAVKLLQELHNAIDQFRSKGYHNRLIREFEKLDLHNDKEPYKYNVEKSPANGEIIKEIMTRSRKTVFDIRGIAECLNDYAAVMSKTIDLSIVPNKFGTGFAPIEDYVKSFMKMFQIDDTSLKAHILDIICPNLNNAIQLTAWPVESYESSHS